MPALRPAGGRTSGNLESKPKPWPSLIRGLNKRRPGRTRDARTPDSAPVRSSDAREDLGIRGAASLPAGGQVTSNGGSALGIDRRPHGLLVKERPAGPGGGRTEEQAEAASRSRGTQKAGLSMVVAPRGSGTSTNRRGVFFVRVRNPPRRRVLFTRSVCRESARLCSKAGRGASTRAWRSVAGAVIPRHQSYGLSEWGLEVVSRVAGYASVSRSISAERERWCMSRLAHSIRTTSKIASRLEQRSQIHRASIRLAHYPSQHCSTRGEGIIGHSR